LSQSPVTMAWMLDYAKQYQQWLMLAMMIKQRRRIGIGHDLQGAMTVLTRWVLNHQPETEATFDTWLNWCEQVAPATDVFSDWYSDYLANTWKFYG
jgi:hypothetical protein